MILINIRYNQFKIKMEAQNENFGEQPTKKVKVDESQLDRLRKHSVVVADTGDFNQIEKYRPEDSTTNPTLINQATKLPEFKGILDTSIEFGIKFFENYCGTHSRSKKKNAETKPAEWTALEEWQREELIDLIFDHICVSFGCKILEKVKGFVSTEVDARLSFNKNQTVKRAKRIIALYEQAGADASRVLIKIATTWEGIKAAEVLNKSKIKCNMTLIFHIAQAVAVAHSKLFLISPFVGRILDWNKKEYNKTYDNPADDPGVISVTEIFNYYAAHKAKTIIMGASFRNVDEIKQLAGCDKLTISPALLEKLHEGTGDVPLRLDREKAATLDIEEIGTSEEEFRYAMNSSKMATDLLSAGIRSFEDAGRQLKSLIRKTIEGLHENKEAPEAPKPTEQAVKPAEEAPKQAEAAEAIVPEPPAQ